MWGAVDTIQIPQYQFELYFSNLAFFSSDYASTSTIQISNPRNQLITCQVYIALIHLSLGYCNSLYQLSYNIYPLQEKERFRHDRYHFLTWLFTAFIVIIKQPMVRLNRWYHIIAPFQSFSPEERFK